MRVVDTNVVVRILVDDDPVQVERAQALLAQGGVLILKTVLLESEWVLRSIYRLGRRRIASVLRGLLGLPGVTVEDSAAVARALDWLDREMDFGDALHLASTPPGATFVSFDRALVRQAARLVGAPTVRDLAR